MNCSRALGVNTYILGILVFALSSFNASAVDVLGSVPGNFSVSQTGAAQYSIPIEVPRGSGGVRPSISLQYNHLAGNGIAGQKWMLGGLSQITRCPRTIAQDQVTGEIRFDANDRYCLDGQRLMVTSGSYGASNSHYRTEIESFRKIVANHQSGYGPRYFVVTSRDGTRHWYGFSADARVLDNATNSVIRWSRNAIEDRFGNRIDFEYNTNQSTGEHTLSRIEYSSNVGQPYRHALVFAYENRPTTDQRQGYRFGALWSRTKRLKSVLIQAKDTSGILREHSTYTLAYKTGTSGRSQLERITRCQGRGLRIAIRIRLARCNAWMGRRGLFRTKQLRT